MPKAALGRVALRSLFLQAAWNPHAMQGLGFAYAIAPALAALYPDRAARAQATLRHLEHFNCHPYLAAGILGAAVRLEERVAAGEAAAEEVSAFKRAVAPPFAALGDGFFWLALRPSLGLIAAAAVPLLGLWSALLFVALYNAVHLVARAWLFVLGYRRAEGIVPSVGRVHLPRATEALKVMAGMVAGLLAARSIALALRPENPHLPLRLGHAALVGGTLLAMVALLPRLRFAQALYLALALGLAIGSGFF